MTTLFTNIRQLAGCREEGPLLRGADLARLPCIENAFLIIENGRIASYGRMEELHYPATNFSEHVDATGMIVFPSWCDSHTHLVFAGSREEEFVDKIKGLSYAAIAQAIDLFCE